MALQCVEDAPCFYPTEEDWKDPIAYINRIRVEAEHAGICKIKSPATFRPPFAVDKANFRFRTRVQGISEIDGVARIENRFQLQLRVFLYTNDTPMPRDSSIYFPPAKPIAAILTDEEDLFTSEDFITEASLVPISLYRLFVSVRKHGGIDQVVLHEKWKAVTESLFWKELISNTLIKRVEVFYMKHVAAFERRMKRDITVDNEPANDRLTTGILNSMFEGLECSQKASTTFQKIHVIKQQLQRDIMNMTDPIKKEDVASETSSYRKRQRNEEEDELHPGATFWKYFPDKKMCFFGKLLERERNKNDSWSVKYLLADFYIPNTGSAQDQKRRREQAKKAEPESYFIENMESTDARVFILSGTSGEEAFRAYDIGLCQECLSSKDSQALLTCNSCDCNFHGYCVTPRIFALPETDWFCKKCVQLYDKTPGNLDLEFGYEEGPTYTLNQFGEMADLFLEDLFALDESFGISKPENNAGFEEMYWRIAVKEARKEHSKLLKCGMFDAIHYGSDLDTAKLGSGFPTKAQLDKKLERLEVTGKSLSGRSESHQKTKQYMKKLSREIAAYQSYASHPWNLNNFPTAKGSLLQHVDSSITGVMVPWLYVGMALSSFCFHTEDHNFASINYHHFGAPKVWYGVGAQQAELFEKACYMANPDLFKSKQDLLTGIVTQFYPPDLVANSDYELKIYRIVQEPGDFVLTFPRGYHGGFNQGYNCAEAVNFATPHWIEHGVQCAVRYKTLFKNPVIAHETLLFTLAQLVHASEPTPDIILLAQKLLQPLENMVCTEMDGRDRIINELKIKNIVEAYPGDKRYLEETKLREATDINQSVGLTTGSDLSEDEEELNSGQVVGRERPSIMGRMNGLSQLYKQLNQCFVCKAYCSLSFLFDDKLKTAYCLEHGMEQPQPLSLVILMTEAEMRKLTLQVADFLDATTPVVIEV